MPITTAAYKPPPQQQAQTTSPLLSTKRRHSIASPPPPPPNVCFERSMLTCVLQSAELGQCMPDPRPPLTVAFVPRLTEGGTTLSYLEGVRPVNLNAVSAAATCSTGRHTGSSTQVTFQLEKHTAKAVDARKQLQRQCCWPTTSTAARKKTYTGITGLAIMVVLWATTQQPPRTPPPQGVTHIPVDLPKGCHCVDTPTVAPRRHHVHTHTTRTAGGSSSSSTCMAQGHVAFTRQPCACQYTRQSHADICNP
jgi:hypothetical protein